MTNKKLTIETVKAKKEEIEEKIYRWIKEFEGQTQLEVEKIEIKRIYDLSKDKRVIDKINVKLVIQ